MHSLHCMGEWVQQKLYHHLTGFARLAIIIIIITFNHRHYGEAFIGRNHVENHHSNRAEAQVLAEVISRFIVAAYYRTLSSRISRFYDGMHFCGLCD